MKKVKKFLFIDDSKDFLEGLGELFVDDPNVIFVECHGAKSAIDLVNKHKPDVIFLDHHLTRACNGEGLKVAYALSKRKDITIYSTTGDTSVQSKYKSLGIESIDKLCINKFVEIIENK